MLQLTPVAIGLGGNKGDRAKFLHTAYEHLKEDLLQEARSSSVYETPAWGGVAHAPFLNAVAVGMTDWKPPAIVNFLKELERELGRVSTQRMGDREIDLDLLAYGETVWDSDGVVVPHPGLAERDFVLVPLVEIWPQWLHPKHQKTASSLLERLHSPLKVTRIGASI